MSLLMATGAIGGLVAPSTFGSSILDDLVFAIAATLTPPTHLAPTGNQKDFLVGVAIQTGTAAAPTFDNTVGWTQFALPDDGLGAGIGSNSGSILFAKFCPTSSQTFGTHTNATRTLCWHGRCTNAPATIEELIGDVKFDTKPSGTTNDWVGLALQGAQSHVLTCMMANTNQTAVHRSDTIHQSGQSSGSNRLMRGVSNGLVSAWAAQSVPSGGAGTNTISIAAEILE